MAKQQEQQNEEIRLTYAQAMNEIEQLVAKLQNEQCEIDKLREYTSRALQLIQYCKAKLTATNSELESLLKEFEQE